MGAAAPKASGYSEQAKRRKYPNNIRKYK